MVDRRTQRIRDQLRQHRNPRAGRSSVSQPFVAQMHRMYAPDTTPAPSPNPHTQLAQRLDTRRKGQR